MPVDHDIKDAGILAGFTRWGWPWHGLCEGGAIGSSGKIITQPATGNAWLIDKSLPALDITPAEIASEALAGREWRNYALIPGGSVHGQALPANTYIHVDADGLNWMVTVSGSFPAVNSVRLQLSIVRFGHFQIGATLPTPVLKTVDVSCEDVELSWSGPGGTWYRFGRWVDLQDVWTNGARALLGVFMGTVPDVSQVALFSAIELVLTGSGGADGSGLAVAATEVKPRSSLTTDGLYDGTNSSGTSGSIMSGSFIADSNYVLVEIPDNSTCYGWGSGGTMEVHWTGLEGYVNGYPLVSGYIKELTSCRFCCYGADGTVLAYRLKSSMTIDHWVASYGDTGKLGDYTCYAGACNLGREITVTIAGQHVEGCYLLQNDSVIDKIEHTVAYSGTQSQGRGTYTSNPCDLNLWEIDYPVPYHESGRSWAGSLSALIPVAAYWPTAGASLDLFASWKQVFEVNGGGIVNLSGAVATVGIHRTLNIAGFFTLGTTRNYGTIATPLGNKTTTETGGLYFAWQRKTGEFAFSANPICYV
ncbi:MAG: hypothetical protein M0Q15_15790 [Nevskia sp.]|jgi:hypothetical protein|nr:hypothetical protein [Nevskia sp.]